MRYILLTLFVVYYSSISFFTHTHIVDGVTITHSHPFNPLNRGEIPTHQHTPNGFILISLLSIFVATAALIELANFLLNVIVAKRVLDTSDGILISYLQNYSNGFRAPPIRVS